MSLLMRFCISFMVGVSDVGTAIHYSCSQQIPFHEFGQSCSFLSLPVITGKIKYSITYSPINIRPIASRFPSARPAALPVHPHRPASAILPRPG